MARGPAPKMYRIADVGAFLRAGRRVKRRHEFTLRIAHWPYCAGCGLVALRNEATRIAARGPCWRLED